MPREITTREYFRILNLIYLAQIGAITVFAVVSYYLIQQGNVGEANNELAIVFQKIIIVLVPLSLTAGYVLFRLMIGRVDPKTEIKQKMKRYFNANLIRSAFLEIPGLFVSVAALVTANLLFLVIVPLILIIFLLFRPTKSVVAQELNLLPQERNMLENPDAKISETITE